MTTDVQPKIVIYAAIKGSNAQLIERVSRLGYLDGTVIDLTYGKGNWWKRWKPADLWTNDLDPNTSAQMHFDFTALPLQSDSFDTACFDPAYVSPGGRETSGISTMWDAYGMGTTASSPRATFEYNDRGFAEAIRIVRPGGFVLYKSQDYISSGKLQPVTHWIIEAATGAKANAIEQLERLEALRERNTVTDDEFAALKHQVINGHGVEYFDRIEHLSGARPQPADRRQVHARRNFSTLLIFKV